MLSWLLVAPVRLRMQRILLYPTELRGSSCVPLLSIPKGRVQKFPFGSSWVLP
ncbi:unnamed protein product [Brassica oleracea var. botrytis]